MVKISHFLPKKAIKITIFIGLITNRLCGRDFSLLQSIKILEKTYRKTTLTIDLWGVLIRPVYEYMVCFKSNFAFKGDLVVKKFKTKKQPAINKNSPKPHYALLKAVSAGCHHIYF
jgi:hypothetical protein